MPRATANILDTQRFDLESCPGGYVVLRRLTYGQFLQRQGMAMEMKMTATDKKSGAELDINMVQLKVAEFEFSNCIAEHNLEDDQGTPLDFRKSHNVQLLDPRVGQEIGMRIDSMNQFEVDGQGNS